MIISHCYLNIWGDIPRLGHRHHYQQTKKTENLVFVNFGFKAGALSPVLRAKRRIGEKKLSDIYKEGVVPVPLLLRLLLPKSTYIEILEIYLPNYIVKISIAELSRELKHWIIYYRTE